MEEGRPSLVTLAITIIALLFQLIGFVTPGWLYMVIKNDSLQFGLWYAILCVDSKCVTSSTEEGFPEAGIPQTLYMATMSVFQGLTTVGVIACVVAVIMMCVSRRASEPLQHARKIIIFCLLVSAVLAISASAKFGARIVSAIKLYDKLHQQHPYSFPYSLVLTGFGGILACVMFFKMTCTSCTSRNNETSAANHGGMVLSPPPYTVGKV